MFSFRNNQQQQLQTQQPQRNSPQKSTVPNINVLNDNDPFDPDERQIRVLLKQNLKHFDLNGTIDFDKLSVAQISINENGNNPYENEDGILTALEISNLNLSNTDLVVLSACETGLGDIDGSEGVYGLQRAFKMAGVDLIMMSLWEVPDKETSEFMTIFYTNWLNGEDVRTAFRNTQLKMSTKYKANPEKWAAFVLFE